MPDELIEDIRTRFDIVDIVGRYIELKKKGRTYFGLCPFHSEKTPSFAVSAEKQIYHCFGCGSGGNVFSFLMNIEGLNFIEILKNLSDEAGIELSIKEENNEEVQLKKKLIEAHELAAKYYHYILLETEMGKDAYKYLLNRGFTKETIIDYQLGFAPDSFDILKKFLVKRGFEQAQLVEAGLLSKSKNDKYYDRFRNRVMFPIADSQGRVIAFGGRTIGNDEPKYLNTSDTLIYNKSKNLYNLHKARPFIRASGSVLVFEGYIDVISAYQKGINNSIATLGTSLTIEQARIIRRNTEKAYLVYDGDDAGRDAAIRASTVLESEKAEVTIVQLPKGMDPDDFLQKNSLTDFEELIEKGTSRYHLQKQIIRDKYSFDIGEEKVKYAMEILDIIADIEQAPKREYFLKELSKEVNLSEDSLIDELKKKLLKQKNKNIVKKPAQKWNNHINYGKHSHNQSISIIPAYQKAEREILWIMINDAEKGKKLAEKIRANFQYPEHSLLAAKIYSYYEDGITPSISKLLLDFQDQPDICKLLSSLEFQFEQYDKDSNKNIDSTLLIIEKRKLEAELKSLQSELEIATKTGKQDMIVELLKKIQDYQKKIKLLIK
ncbi:DNA primase [Desulfuribacillus alkaliarsenatis]|uniref:DNA primase n=1 Tax=Desulfuribacillus alkaliarsenatis TaxID=766136 RepID=A0A1E5G0K2_9FIRM|nr:DNA primase [Desulfuribacillus alkaliarsenatis]